VLGAATLAGLLRSLTVTASHVFVRSRHRRTAKLIAMCSRG
jgi:hypothetical protein